MAAILALGAVLLVLWLSGMLTPQRLKWVGAAAVALVALKVLVTGKPWVAAPLLLMAAWLVWREGRRPRVPVSVEQARAVLGVGMGASPAEIRAAWRRAIGSVHPDRGGTADASARVNAARDLLLKHSRGRGRSAD
jgi:hypothetical protein